MLWGCRICDYDTCEQCFATPLDDTSSAVSKNKEARGQGTNTRRKETRGGGALVQRKKDATNTQTVVSASKLQTAQASHCEKVATSRKQFQLPTHKDASVNTCDSCVTLKDQSVNTEVASVMDVKELTAMMAKVHSKRLNNEELNFLGSAVLDLQQEISMEKARREVSANENDDNCIVCFAAPRAVVLLDCGHFVVCGNCAASLKICPICRKKVRDRCRVFSG